MLVDQVKYKVEDYDPNRHSGNIDQLTLLRIPEGKRILDIGCATGFMGHWLQTHKTCTVTTGVEFGPAQAEVARSQLEAVIVGSVESPDVQAQLSRLEPFDVVMSTAAIACMVDPWTLLEKMKTWIAPGGKLLITSANIAHWSIRRDLLFGKWEYADFGVFDVIASLRFFTVNSFRRSLEKAGYTITDFDAEFYDGGPRVLLRRLRLKRPEHWYVQHFANFFAIQFMFEAVPA
jgi:cyclopropane fatty-acyl-phospholipid synthase-like methyltransferase